MCDFMCEKPNLKSAYCQSIRSRSRLERVKGIEPSYAAWEAAVIPLNYTRDFRDAKPVV